jgi:hypothetical protein
VPDALELQNSKNYIHQTFCIIFGPPLTAINP